MKKQAQVLGFLALALAAGGAAAQSATPPAGWYGGLELGRAHLGASGQDIDGAFASQGITGTAGIARNRTAWGLSLGYRASPYWGLEAGYEDFGRFNYSDATTAPAADTIDGKYRAHAWSFAGLGYVPIGANWSLYGKAGLTRTRAELDAASQTGATAPSGAAASRTGLLFGAGVNYDFSRSLFAKVGWDRYTRVGDAASTGRGDVDVVGLGIGFRF